MLAKWSYLNFISGCNYLWNKQLIDAIGHCNITAETGYFAALYTTGYVPKLNPHKITSLILTLYVNQAKTISKSLHITS